MSLFRATGLLAEVARSSRSVSELCEESFAIFKQVVSFESAVFTEPNTPTPLAHVGLDGTDLGYIHRCETNIARYAPELKNAFAIARRVGGFLDTEVFSSRDRRELRLYNEIVKPQRVTSTILLQPSWHDGPLGIMRLQRYGTAFSRDEFATALQLMPVLQVSMAAVRASPKAPAVELQNLSARETQIARYVQQGLTTPQVALLLGTSQLTVRNQLSQIFRKLRVSRRSELAAWMARHAK